MEALLARFRKRHALTQAEAAALVGVGLSTWRQVEQEFRGRKPTLQMRKHLEALDALAVAGLPWPGREAVQKEAPRW